MIKMTKIATLCTSFLLSFSVCQGQNPSFDELNSANFTQDSLAILSTTHTIIGDEPYLHRLYATAFHRLVALSDAGDLVQLEDASKWYVNPSQSYVVLSWVQTDEIFVKPTTSYFSSYLYMLYNRTTGQVVEANLASPPEVVYGQLMQIVNIDFHKQLIQLSDNSVWSVNLTSSMFANWKIGQRIIVGVNNHWFYAAYPQVLINADLYNQPHCLVNYYGFGI